jgi:L-serine deaminase
LFFGFKAGNVTGDLVKQVQQQGVENFVANTEIIMTNNFNGMTTDEVADTILDKINERAAMENIGVTRA